MSRRGSPTTHPEATAHQAGEPSRRDGGRETRAHRLPLFVVARIIEYSPEKSKMETFLLDVHERPSLRTFPWSLPGRLLPPLV